MTPGARREQKDKSPPQHDPTVGSQVCKQQEVFIPSAQVAATASLMECV